MPGQATVPPGPAPFGQLAVQVTAGTVLVPVHEPRNPKLVLAAAARLPL